VVCVHALHHWWYRQSPHLVWSQLFLSHGFFHKSENRVKGRLKMGLGDALPINGVGDGADVHHCANPSSSISSHRMDTVIHNTAISQTFPAFSRHIFGIEIKCISNKRISSQNLHLLSCTYAYELCLG